jgi:beta-lactam-binding protein with PASTA domain
MSDEEIKEEKTEEPKIKKEKKPRKPFNIKNLRLGFGSGFEKLQSNLGALIVTCISAFLLMIVACLAIFFINVKGAEKVLVPDVVGKKWDEALIEMQIKELYPKINLRYSNVPGDEGMVLEQSPSPGAIVKGYSRVNLVISRGVVIDAVGDYVGKNLSEVQMSLQTLFAGQTKPLIVLGTPSYIPDNSEAGTILEQDPPEGTKISEPVTVQLVVSKGPNYENTRRPYVIGQSINDLLQTIARTKIVFDITSHTASEGEKPGTVVSQQEIKDEYVPNYTRVTVEMAMPEHSSDSDNISGIFQEKLPDYPYPVPMKLDAYPAEGTSYTIVSFNHPGGNLTIPYEVPRGTTLVLSVADKVEARKLVE